MQIKSKWREYVGNCGGGGGGRMEAPTLKGREQQSPGLSGKFQHTLGSS